MPLIISILAAVALAAWGWFVRRRTLQEPSPQRLQTEEQPPAKNVQSTALADVAVPKPQQLEEPTDPPFAPATGDSVPAANHEANPAMHVIAAAVGVPAPAVEVSLEVGRSPMVTLPVPTVSVEPIAPPPTSPIAASETMNETHADQHQTKARGAEPSHPSSASPPTSGLNVEAMATPPEVAIRPHTEAQVSISDTDSHTGESASQPSTSDEPCNQSGALLDKTEAKTVADPKLNEVVQSELDEGRESPLAEIEPPSKAPIYQPPKPPTQRKKPSRAVERASDSTPREEIELHVRLKLKFGRGGVILTLVPDWRAEMPNEVDITGTQGKLRLVKSSGGYEDVPLVDASKLLHDGVE
jgi:hypothetical protein